MKRILLPEETGARVPIHIWARAPPSEAVAQLIRLASQPWITAHLAAMPDLHVANTVAVGTVFATEDAVVPAALGGDLGCGMTAARFDVPAASLSAKSLRAVLGEMSRRIPVGDGVHRGKGVTAPDGLMTTPLSTAKLEHERERLLRRQLRTLGGGNHFVELDRGAAGDLWLLVHTGSRGLGAAIAHHHARVADSRGTGAPAGLRGDSEEGRACLSDLGWAFEFAQANRQAILQAASESIGETLGIDDAIEHFDVQHNFVRREDHDGRWLYVHRKGAIAAATGQRGLIPGSMGTATYVVEGLGDSSSFRSASHGAGRVMTRKEARQRIRVDQLRAALRRVVFDEHRLSSMAEEAPAAYRPIAEVLEDETDLVKPLLRLEPIAVMKG